MSDYQNILQLSFLILRSFGYKCGETVESRAVGLVLLVLRGWGVSSFGFFLPEAYNAYVAVGVGQVKVSAG